MDPRLAQRFIRDPSFQALDPRQQLAAFRSLAAREDPDFIRLGELDQVNLAQTAIEQHQPGFLSKLADVGEHIPLVGAPIRGARAFEAGEPLSPLAGFVTGGRQPTSATEQALIETGVEFAPLLAAGGATAAARPLISAAASRLIGGTAARTLVGQAIDASTRVAGKKLAGEAARVAVRQRIVERGLTDLTFGEAFGVFDALERGIAGGEQEPLHDFVVTPLAVAALGLGIMGLGGLRRHLGAQAGEVAAAASRAVHPERLAALEGEAGPLIDAVHRASGRRLSRTDAADLVFDAATRPLEASAETRLIRHALLGQPELLESELGLRLMLQQQTKLLKPEVRIRRSPGVVATVDDLQGVTQVVEARTTAEVAALRRRIERGELALVDAVGDNTALIRLGAIEAVEVEALRGPGGRVVIRPLGERIGETLAPSLGELAVIDPGEMELRALINKATRENMVPILMGRPLRTTSPPPKLIALPPPETALIDEGGGNFTIRLAGRPGAPPSAEQVIQPPVGIELIVHGTTLRGRTISKVDPLGHVEVVLPNSQRISAPITSEGDVAVAPELIDLFIESIPGGIGIPARILPASRTKLMNRIQPGQVVVSSSAKQRATGRRHVITVIERRDGDVLVRSGSTRLSVPVRTIVESVERGDAELLVGAGRLPGEALHRITMFEGGIAGRQAAGRRTKAKLFADEQLRAELAVTDVAVGQVPPMTTASAPSQAIRKRQAKRRAREAKPVEERSRGGNEFVKGCPPKGGRKKR